MSQLSGLFLIFNNISGPMPESGVPPTKAPYETSSYDDSTRTKRKRQGTDRPPTQARRPERTLEPRAPVLTLVTARLVLVCTRTALETFAARLPSSAARMISAQSRRGRLLPPCRHRLPQLPAATVATFPSAILSQRGDCCPRPRLRCRPRPRRRRLHRPARAHRGLRLRPSSRRRSWPRTALSGC